MTLLYKNIEKKEIREAISLRILNEVVGATNYDKGQNGRSKVYVYANGVKGYVAYVSAYNKEMFISNSCPAEIAEQMKKIRDQESNGPVEVEGVAPLTLENSIPAVTPVYEIEKAAAVMAANEQPLVAQAADAINALNEVALVATPEDQKLIAYEIREASYYLNLLASKGYSRKDLANFTAQLEKRVARLNTGYGVLAQKYAEQLAQQQAQEAGVIFIAGNTPTPTPKKEEVAKTKATRSDVFKAAHALARQQKAEGATGTYRALLSAALKATYKVVILI